MARGLGSRMRNAASDVSLSTDEDRVAATGVKALIPIDRPFLDYVLSNLADAGYRHICLVIGPEHEELRRYYGEEIIYQRLQVSFTVQTQPRGTADAVAAAEPIVGVEPFLVINSDNYYPVDALRALRVLTGSGLAVFSRAAMLRLSNIDEERLTKFAVVETDASCTFTSWWQLLKVSPGFDEKWRESVFPGGCSHAGELETSMLMYLSPESVREDKIKSEIAKTNKRGSKYIWGDLFGKSAMGLVEWTSQYSDSGVMGEAEKATAEKGKTVFEEASKNLAEFIEEYHGTEIAERTSHHAQEPTFPLSFPTD